MSAVPPILVRYRSIVVRFSPAALSAPREYLAQVDGAWTWTADRTQAHVFASHSTAHDEASKHPYCADWDDTGYRHTPWALVVEDPVFSQLRRQKWEGRDAQVERSATGADRCRVSPIDVYARTAERLGEAGD